VKAKHRFHIDAMVILPDHLHALWTLPASDSGSFERLGGARCAPYGRYGARTLVRFSQQHVLS
jgi:REP element-mobilizing transposase RayT